MLLNYHYQTQRDWTLSPEREMGRESDSQREQEGVWKWQRVIKWQIVEGEFEGKRQIKKETEKITI